MRPPHPSRVQLLGLADLEAYLRYADAHARESGRDGDPHFGPYGRDEPYGVDDMRLRSRERWSKALEVTGWRRAFGVYEGTDVIAAGDVTGADLPAGLHRVELGMGVLRPHRRRGLGRAVLGAIIDWCRAQPSIAWIDLGVIGDNPGAAALYRSMGFVETGHKQDRWRLDGGVAPELSMSLRLRG